MGLEVRYASEQTTLGIIDNVGRLEFYACAPDSWGRDPVMIAYMNQDGILRLLKGIPTDIELAVDANGYIQIEYEA